ncbi:hypothetical protein BHE74_00028636 [Ensete ventricosum]|nr:hypothetical protein GW17_00022012 [Ensete ventricosum]RWW64125.1 hypothetical protein BHE74_00028636 [Ensete ventricosum]
MLDSSVLMLYRMPSYLISLLEVKLIKLPMYESADAPDLAVSAAIAAAAASTSSRGSQEERSERSTERKQEPLPFHARERGRLDWDLGRDYTTQKKPPSFRYSPLRMRENALFRLTPV